MYVMQCDIPLSFSPCFLGSIPLDPSLTQSLEEGKRFIELFPNSPTLEAVNHIATKLLSLKKN